MSSATPTLDRLYLQPGQRLCAAVSGGSDSVALLLLLHAENTQPRNALGVGLSAIHVHHGLRAGEADADLVFVQTLCNMLSIPLHIHHASVPERLDQSRRNGSPETTEEAARELRYAAFRTLIHTGAADAVLTAHTLDDQAETVLMKLLRGAWTEGLGGIHPILPIEASSPTTRRGAILRPLLGCTRAALRDYLTARNQPWREDSSNLSSAHTRNRIRHTILPLLREENPSLDRTLAAFATIARDEDAYWTAELARILPHLVLPGRPVRGGGRAVSTSTDSAAISIELERLRPLAPALRRRVLRAAARSLGARLSFDETERLLILTGLTPSAAPVKIGAQLDLSQGLRASRSARELRLEKLSSPRTPQPRTPPIPHA